MGNQLKLTEEQVNQTYEHQLPFHMNVDGPKKPTYSSGWERAVAYHHGLFVPETYQPTKTADDIRLAVASFSEKVHQDSPKDACKYLQIQECQWDQAKFNAGTTYIEGPQMRRRRPYIFYP